MLNSLQPEVFQCKTSIVHPQMDKTIDVDGVCELKRRRKMFKKRFMIITYRNHFLGEL